MRGGNRYEIRIRGRIGDPLLESFEGLVTSVRSTETVLSGRLPDQPALYGILGRVQALGLELVEVRRVDDPPV